MIPSWLEDTCTFVGAFWLTVLAVSLTAFLVLTAVGVVQERFRKRREVAGETAKVIDLAERITKEHAQ